MSRAPLASLLGSPPAPSMARSRRARVRARRAGRRPRSPRRLAGAAAYELLGVLPTLPGLLAKLIHSHQACANRVKRGLGAALDGKLFQDAGDVGLDRPLLDEEGACYLLVR